MAATLPFRFVHFFWISTPFIRPNSRATRIYCQGCGNGYNTNYSSDKHFMGDFGAGIKFYPKGGFFVRPEAKLYLVNNNLNFSSARITRFGLSIGYTFGGH